MRYRLYIYSFFLLIGCTKPNKTISILYFTDAHEIAPVDDQHGNRGGVARLKVIVDDLRNKNHNTFVIFGGDLAGGTLFGGVYQGLPMVEAFNLVPIDIANFGQHDFDFGVENTLRLIDNSSFKWISSNLKDSKGNVFASLPTYQILDASNGDMKIGVIGLTDALNTSIQDERLVQGDIYNSARIASKELKSQGVNYIIAITQTTISVNENILQEVDAIDLILTEEISENKSFVTYVGHKPIVSTCGNMGSLAEVILEKDEDKISTKLSIHSLGESIKEDTKLLELQQKYMNELEEDLSEILSISEGSFMREGSRKMENPLGNLIADAFRDYYDADIALLNGGGIRANIFEGEVTLKDAYSVLPFRNSIYLVELSGLEIASLLNRGILNVPSQGGDFLQVSGFSYSYVFISNEKLKIKEIKVGNQSIIPDKNYKVALPSFIFFGGGAFDALSNDKIINSELSSKKDIDILVEYLRGQQTITPSLSGRIKVHSGK